MAVARPSEKGKGQASPEKKVARDPLSDPSNFVKEWRTTPVYREALRSSNNDYRLTSAVFANRMDSWPPNPRVAFLRSVSHVKNPDALFDEGILDAMPQLERWNPECISLLLRAYCDAKRPDGKPDPLTDRVFLEKVGRLKFSLQKVYLNDLMLTNAVAELTEPKTLDRISNGKTPDLTLFQYLSDIGGKRKFTPFDEWEQSQKAQISKS